MTDPQLLSLILRVHLRLSHSAASRSRRVIKAARPVVESPRDGCEWTPKIRGGR